MTVLAPDLWHPTPLLERLLLMAGTKSDFLETKIKNLILGNVAYTIPSPVYFALWTSALTDASVGNTAGEVTGGSYDRVSVTNNTTNFPTVADNISKKNGIDITFPAATANWGTVSYVGVFDGNLKTAADNLLLWADLTVAKAVNSGDTAKFLTNDFTWTED